MNSALTRSSSEPSEIASWSSELPADHLAGSLYAVPAKDRVASARSLHEAGHSVHLDLIIGPDDRHVGVSPEEVRALHYQLPEATLDLHMILLDDRQRPAAERTRFVTATLELAREVHADCLTLPRSALISDPQSLPLGHSVAPRIWQQLSPGEPTDIIGQATGALVMLIEPGTDQQADPSRLELVADLVVAGVPVGVDGGVNRPIARRAHELGATRIISGRALLQAFPQRAR